MNILTSLTASLLKVLSLLLATQKSVNIRSFLSFRWLHRFSAKSYALPVRFHDGFYDVMDSNLRPHILTQT